MEDCLSNVSNILKVQCDTCYYIGVIGDYVEAPAFPTRGLATEADATIS